MGAITKSNKRAKNALTWHKCFAWVRYTPLLISSTGISALALLALHTVLYVIRDTYKTLARASYEIWTFFFSPRPSPLRIHKLVLTTVCLLDGRLKNNANLTWHFDFFKNLVLYVALQSTHYIVTIQIRVHKKIARRERKGVWFTTLIWTRSEESYCLIFDQWDEKKIVSATIQYDIWYSKTRYSNRINRLLYLINFA